MPEAPAARWHISNIEVKAFKSFGGSWSSFDIKSPHLVGIIGPNGSGKSNLLEAVCFATGGSTSVMRCCKTLRDVTSTEAGSQLPEVRLRFSQGKAESHLLETSLTPEGSRTYRINGKLKRGIQVKEFLRAIGITVDSKTVIQQASITSLSDSNNPTTLADLLAAASGLNSWKQETAVARQEIIRTRRALTDIQANISKVQAAAAEEAAAMQAAEQAERLQQQLESILQQLLPALQQQTGYLQHQVETCNQKKHELQESLSATTDQLQQLAAWHQRLATQQAQLLADLESLSASSGSNKLSTGAAAAEAQIAVLQAAAASYQSVSNELQAKKQLLVQEEAQADKLQKLLHIKRQAAAQASSSLAALNAAKDAAAALQQQVQQARQHAAAAAVAITQQETVVADSATRLQRCTDRAAGVQSSLQQLLQQQQQPTSKQAAQGSSFRLIEPNPSNAVQGLLAPETIRAAAAASAAKSAEEVQAQSAEISGMQQQLLQLQMDSELLASPLLNSSTAAVLAACISSNRQVSAIPLHQCFRIKEADSRSTLELLMPLSAIAAPATLQVLVAATMQDADALLLAAGAIAKGHNSVKGRYSSSNGGHKLKIWPLDNLKVHSMLQAQRAAQQQLGADRVILPLDRLDYSKQHESVMIRAFANYVIAADDATAALLIQRFGLSSVTLQGSVSRKGSLSGGWVDGSGGNARSFWASKLKFDAAAMRLGLLQLQLSTAVAHQQQLEQGRQHAEQQLAVAEQVLQLQQELQHCETAAAAADTRLQLEQQCLEQLQRNHKHLQVKVQQCTDALQNSTTHADSSRGRGRKESVALDLAAALRHQLQMDAQQVEVALQDVQQQLEVAQDQVEQLAASIDSLELQLSNMGNPSDIQQQLQMQQRHLEQLRQQHAQQQAQQQEVQSQLQQLQQQMGQLNDDTQQQRQRQAALQEQLQQAAAKATEAAASLKQCNWDMKQLTQEFADSEAAQALRSKSTVVQKKTTTGDGCNIANSDTDTGAGSGSEAVAKELQQLAKRVRQLQSEALHLEVPELPDAHKELCRSRSSQVGVFIQQMEALQASTDAVEQRIASNAHAVFAANDAMFEDVAVGFSQLCSSLIPSLEIQLIKHSRHAHEGLHFRFRRLEGAARAAAATDPSPDDKQWHTSLSQLSGGQRTLVSLAMLLATARTGGGSGLLLMDEIDAALDEHNQTRAAALLRQLAHAPDGMGCQILCVTHNAAFQQACDAFLQVVTGPGGSRSATTAAATGQNDPNNRVPGHKATKGRKQASHRASKSKKPQAVANRSKPVVASNDAAIGSRGTGRSAKKVHFAE